MTAQQIINSRYTKTRKMQLLFELGKTRSEVASLLGCGYGFVQNVYRKTYPERYGIPQLIRPRVYCPTAFDRQFGIEIEFYGVNKQRLINSIEAKGVAVATGYRSTAMNTWKVTTDGSIRSTRGDACEIVSPILRGQDGLDQLQKICEALEENGALINKSCGLHIHFDARNLNLDKWKALSKNYAICEDSIDSMMPRSRRKSKNTYCRSMRYRKGRHGVRAGHITQEELFTKIDAATNIKDLAQAVTGRDRYRKLNYESHFRLGTVEFRQHSGTREYAKMSNWILFLHRMMDYSEQGFVLPSGSFTDMTIFMESTNHDYYHNRIQELAA